MDNRNKTAMPTRMGDRLAIYDRLLFIAVVCFPNSMGVSYNSVA